jgi:hypothetical protein
VPDATVLDTTVPDTGPAGRYTRTGTWPPGPGIEWLVTSTPGAVAPKIQSVTRPAGNSRLCMAMTCSSVFPATEDCRRVSHANARTRRSIRAIRYSLAPEIITR